MQSKLTVTWSQMAFPPLFWLLRGVPGPGIGSEPQVRPTPAVTTQDGGTQELTVLGGPDLRRSPPLLS